MAQERKIQRKFCPDCECPEDECHSCTDKVLMRCADDMTDLELFLADGGDPADEYFVSHPDEGRRARDRLITFFNW
jgi:hypothetical protein